MGIREGYDETGDETWPSIEPVADGDQPGELLSPFRLLQYLDASERAGVVGEFGHADAAHTAYADDDFVEDPDLPRVLSMPDGITVDERLVGRAVAQWILQVRCDCGRRWFEVEEVDTATCPRCGVLVYVDLDARSTRPVR